MWLSRVTLDIIGTAGKCVFNSCNIHLHTVPFSTQGFNFELNSLDVNGDSNELARAFRIILRSDVSARQLIKTLAPFTRFIVRISS